MFVQDTSHYKTDLIVLAAGKGSRMMNFIDTPKPLVQISGEPLLQRTLRQFHELGLHNLYVVTGFRESEVTQAAYALFPETNIIHNQKFSEDRNIYSLLMALRQVQEGHGVLVLEGDVVLKDSAVMALATILGGQESVWTACGHFQPHQVGGILNVDKENRVVEIRYSDYLPSLCNWYKNLGVIYITPTQIVFYRNLLEKYVSHSLDFYFMTPWQEHIAELPALMLDVGEHGGVSFNTPEEYARAQRLTDSQAHSSDDIVLLDIHQLRHIEAVDQLRVAWLARKIMREGVWTAPIAASNEHHLVMDGQHRMEAALQLGLRRIPALLFDYQKIPVYSLRPEFNVNVQEIIARAFSGDIYPYKTAKHILPPITPCRISLTELQ